MNNSAALAGAQQTNVITSGVQCRVTFTVQNYVSGTVNLRHPLSQNVSANGTYVFEGAANDTKVLIRGSAVTNNFEITNISVVEVQGDKPRLDYDPINPTCPHLLLEPQSTNLITFSENFSQWDSIGSTQTSVENVNPLNATAYKIESTVNTGSRIFINGIMTSTNTYSSSYLVKATSNSPQYLGFACISNTVPDVLYNFANDQFEDNTISGNAAKCESISMANDWKLLKVPVHSSVTNTRLNIYQGSKSGNQLVGTIGQSYFIKLAQLEELSFCTSYIPTAGATGTRVGETCNNAGNVDTFNSEEGVLYAEIAALANDGTFREITLNDGTVNNVIEFRYNNVDNEIQFVVRDGGSVTVNSQVAFSDVLEYNKIAFQYKANDFKVFANGSNVATDTSGTVPSGLNQLDFSWAENNKFYGKVKSLATYNRALTDNELYTITSTQYSAYSGMVAALGNYTIPC